MKQWMCLLLALLLAGSVGCAKPSPALPEDGRLQVIATNFPGYDFARQVAGDKISLSLLLPPGAESHSFEPTPQDILALQRCDLLICVGGESETWLEGILASVEEGPAVLSMMELVEVVEEELKEGMEAEETLGGQDADHPYDEHVWTDPANARLIVAALSAGLADLDKDNGPVYRENAQAYDQALANLDAAFRQAVEAGSRSVLVFGDRFPFRYFVEAYGLDYFAAFPGCSAQTQPSTRTVVFLIEKVQEEQIPVVFTIELSNEKMADTICEATGAKKLLFHSGHNLSKQDFEGGVTYLALMEQNLANLKEALA